MFQLAKRLDRFALICSYLAIISFVVLGTISFLPAYKSNMVLGKSVYYVPAVIILLSMPMTFMSGWLLHRLNLGSTKTYLAIFIAAGLLFFTGPFWGWAAWLGIPWVLKWHIQGFEKFLQTTDKTPDSPITE